MRRFWACVGGGGYVGIGGRGLQNWWKKPINMAGCAEVPKCTNCWGPRLMAFARDTTDAERWNPQTSKRPTIRGSCGDPLPSSAQEQVTLRERFNSLGFVWVRQLWHTLWVHHSTPCPHFLGNIYSHNSLFDVFEGEIGNSQSLTNC